MIRGRLTDRDDYNDTPVPRNSVRPEGHGPCYASSYRRDATCLLFLRSTIEGMLTPYWSSLSRVNDQIDPAGDEWLEWVRAEVLVAAEFHNSLVVRPALPPSRVRCSHPAPIPKSGPELADASLQDQTSSSPCSRSRAIS